MTLLGAGERIVNGGDHVQANVHVDVEVTVNVQAGEDQGNTIRSASPGGVLVRTLTGCRLPVAGCRFRSEFARLDARPPVE